MVRRADPSRKPLSLPVLHILLVLADGDHHGYAIKQEVDRLVRDFRASERMPGVDRIWMPGEQSHEKRVRQAREGITLAPQLVKTLNAVADELGIEPLGEA